MSQCRPDSTFPNSPPQCRIWHLVHLYLGIHDISTLNSHSLVMSEFEFKSLLTSVVIYNPAPHSLLVTLRSEIHIRLQLLTIGTALHPASTQYAWTIFQRQAITPWCIMCLVIVSRASCLQLVLFWPNTGTHGRNLDARIECNCFIESLGNWDACGVKVHYGERTNILAYV